MQSCMTQVPHATSAAIPCVFAPQVVRLGMEYFVGVWFSDKLGSGLGLYLGVYAGLGAAYALNTLARCVERSQA